MKFFRSVGVIICIQIVRYVSALELIPAKNHMDKYPNQIEYPNIIIEKILHRLGTNQIHAVNVTQMSTKLGYSQQAIQAAASILKDQHIYFSAEKILDLRSKIDFAFDIISQNINLLESSLDRSVCIADFGVLDVQNALQVVIDLCVSSNFGKDLVPTTEATIFSSETIASSTYCLSSSIKTFITSAKAFTSNKIVDTNVISGVQAIVESVLSIVDIVLRSLKEMKVEEKIFDHQQMKMLSSSVGQLNSQRFHLPNFKDDAISPFTDIANTTRTRMQNLPSITDANIAILLKYILTPHEVIPTFNNTEGPIKILQSQLRVLSSSVRSNYANDDLTGYTLDTSSQNLIATFVYLTNSVAALPVALLYIREFHEVIEPDFQANLLFITSNIRTLGDEVTLVIERRLIDLICLSSSVDKTILQKQLKELHSSINSIILTFEKVVRSSVETVRNNMFSVYAMLEGYDFKYDPEAQTLYTDTKQLIGDLDGILSKKATSTIPSKENAFTVCSKAFEEVVESPLKMKAFLRKSIVQIERYLL